MVVSVNCQRIAHFFLLGCLLQWQRHRCWCCWLRGHHCRSGLRLRWQRWQLAVTGQDCACLQPLLHLLALLLLLHYLCIICPCQWLVWLGHDTHHIYIPYVHAPSMCTIYVHHKYTPCMYIIHIHHIYTVHIHHIYYTMYIHHIHTILTS